jgi:ankyrin repeat protein
MTRFLYIDADGQRQGPIDGQQLRELMTQGVIVSTMRVKLVESETEWQGTAGEIPPELLSPDPSVDIFSRDLYWILFGASCFLALVGLFVWIVLTLIVAPVAVIFGILAIKGRIDVPTNLSRETIYWIIIGASYYLAILGFLLWIPLAVIALSVAVVFWWLIGKEREFVWEKQATPQALYDRACQFRSERKYSKAIRLYEMLAKQGHQEVQYELALVYHTGEGKRKDPVRAIFWFKKAAEQGHAEAKEVMELIGKPCPKQSRFSNIFDAAKEGNVEDLRYFVEKRGVCINTKNDNGVMLQVFAAGNSNVNVIKYLVFAGVNVNTISDNGMTSMHYAAFGGNIDVLEYLISLGADINVMGIGGTTPLYLAVKPRLHVANPGPLEPDTTLVLQYLISKGANVNVKDSDCNTLLHNAAGNSDFALVEFLVSQGADVNAKNDVGRTPINFAIANNSNIDILRYLVSKGAKVNNGGLVHVAAVAGNVNAIEYLISLGVSIDGRNEEGRTPLILAALFSLIEFGNFLGNRKHVLECLISHGANVNASAKNDGFSLLHFAAHKGDIEFAQFLVSNGADVNIRTNIKGTNFTPLDFAVECDKTELARYISSVGGRSAR